MTGSIQEVSSAIAKLVDDGATEIQFQPFGPDVRANWNASWTRPAERDERGTPFRRVG